MKKIEEYFSNELNKDGMYFQKDLFLCDMLTELEKSKVLAPRNINMIMEILDKEIDISDYIMVSANGNNIGLADEDLKSDLSKLLKDDIYSLSFVIMYFIETAFDVDYDEE
ncbi:hypothetical protein SAMN02745134_00816 [Clostridium acidisoli DSM 12555]|uniref:Uncharacterized protein n=1 Tax=Clostridium acidisoli DSM 12555 TaxID=1121291 RepID=A0A1W1X669_9CLOT|nr:hypothetical protein [Clostridium acidisoli]SMC19394.1 hypothetical protein SAMN02745134_00816 [Clostridium acidisoli DSM 12555]